MNKKYIIGFFALTLLFACEPKIAEFSSSDGTADFTTYVALGNSLTAGYASNALSRQGQIYSYPNMLAEQFAKVGMQGNFVQPLMPLVNGTDPGIGITGSTFHPRLILGGSLDCLGVTSLGPVLAPTTASSTDLQGALLTSVFADQGPFNNFGVPGAKAAHLLAPGYGSMANLPAAANPYYIRFASSAATSVLADAMAQNPTFFSLWIGNNDVLGYATSGGVGDILTPVANFQAYMTAIVTTLTSNGSKGVIANIPNVTSIPFFTTVPYNALVLTAQAQVDALTAAYAGLNTARVGLGLSPITFGLGQNAMIIADASAPGGMRQILSNELILLSIPQDNIKCSGWGSAVPIPNQYVLTTTEIAAINAAITSFNTIIADLATTNNLALADMNTHLNSLQTGLIYDGIGVNTTFVTGGAFSLDGVHLNPRGYAIVGNFFIDAINTHYEARVPKINISEYPGVVFP